MKKRSLRPGFHNLQRYSIKTRVTLFTLAIFLLGLWSLTFFTSRMLRQDMQRMLADQQFSTVSFIASGVNDDLTHRLNALDKFAAAISPAISGNPAALQSHLEQHQIFQDMFNGVYIARIDGVAIASTPLLGKQIGTSYLDRDYIAAALTEGKASIGKRVIGKTLQTPIVGMAVPIRDDQNRVIGAMAGVLDLGKLNFLDKFIENNYGKTGGYLLVDSKNRLVVMATDKKALEVVIPPLGVSPVIDRFIQGYEGSDIFVNPRGDEVLASAKGVPVMGGYVTAQLPTREAFAPIRDMQQRMLMAALFLSVLAGGLTWWVLKRQLFPIFETTKILTNLAHLDTKPQPLPIACHDEIGQLIGAFNHLLESLANREAALQGSEHRAHAILEASPVSLAINDSHGNIISLNKEFLRVIGYTLDDIPTLEDWWSRAYPDPQYRQWVVAQWRENLEETKRTGKPFSPMELLIRCKDNSVRTFICSAADFAANATDVDGEHLVILFDITDRKEMEDQVRKMALHDPLTGLPNRTLLSDRLMQTMSAGRRSGCYSALMFVDLDNFKPLNDKYGHAVGDLLLIEVAARLKKCVRQMDTVARIGGDEFVVVLAELNTDKTESISQAEIVAEKMGIALAAPYQLPVKHHGHAATTIEYLCTASIGVALFIDAEVNDILIQADAAMYQAKEAGRNSIRFFEPKA